MALRCTRSFAAYQDGKPRVVKAGSLVADDDPVVKGREGSFQTVDAHLQRRRGSVEAATADPGTVRTLTPPVQPLTPPEPSGGDAYDPTAHSNREVLAYLATATEAEALRVLDAEAAAPTPRAGICKMRDQVLDDARARDAAAAGSE
ncbi:hypothetical protein ACFWNI_33480 [Streptomyces sp. NPDC058377]|uniref:hypothetical protein n=1 Tax=Streptomyces sp. NPDC058377 TaxID=3346468 RepID=UPI0036565026